MNKLLTAFCLYAITALAACTDTEVIVNEHYGVCMTDGECPGTSVCLDGVCVEPEEPTSYCQPYEWAGRNTPWYCWCEGGDCIGTEQSELSWSCSLDLIPGDRWCSVQCHDHFWLDVSVVDLDQNTSPPSLMFDRGTSLVTCTQYVDMSPLRFVRSGTAIYLLWNNNRVVNIDFKLTKPGVATISYRTNPGNPWIYGGIAFTYSTPLASNIGNIQYFFSPEVFPQGTTTYWRLEARPHVNDFNPDNDIWEGSQILP